jgi:hypothetical protein
MAKLPKMTTRWEFEQWFYEHSTLSNEKIKSLGLQAEECNGPCADRHCRGWQMVSERERKRRPENAKW